MPRFGFRRCVHYHEVRPVAWTDPCVFLIAGAIRIAEFFRLSCDEFRWKGDPPPRFWCARCVRKLRVSLGMPSPVCLLLRFRWDLQSIVCKSRRLFDCLSMATPWGELRSWLWVARCVRSVSISLERFTFACFSENLRWQSQSLNAANRHALENFLAVWSDMPPNSWLEMPCGWNTLLRAHSS